MFPLGDNKKFAAHIVSTIARKYLLTELICLALCYSDNKKIWGVDKDEKVISFDSLPPLKKKKTLWIFFLENKKLKYSLDVVN